MSLGNSRFSCLAGLVVVVACSDGGAFSARAVSSTGGAGGEGSGPARASGGAAPLAEPARDAATSVTDAAPAAGGRAALVCVPGRSEACTGPGGCLGGQACAADGTRFEDCVCQEPGSGGASGSGGTGGAGRAASGASGAAGGSAEPAAFTGPDGRLWACSRWASSDGTVHRCECAWYAPGARDWHCSEPGYDCSQTECRIYRNDCCSSAAHFCQCAGDGTVQNCSDTTPVASCP